MKNSCKKVWRVAAVLPLLVGCGDLADGLCAQPGCLFTEEEWERVVSLANLEEPLPDPANKYESVAAAQRLGQQLFWDPRFSGVATQVDTLGRPTVLARAPRGEKINLSCASCHDPGRGGGDYTSSPGHVSVGAGWYDVNASSVINATYYQLKYWNGRYDSLVWQAIGVTESAVSMNGNRVEVAWLLHDHYRDAYDVLFPEYPLPSFGRSFAEQEALLLTDGQCALVGSSTVSVGCPTNLGCQVETSTLTGLDTCWPRFPLRGKPQAPPSNTCRRESSAPFFDAFDCMTPEDRAQITRVYVNFAKALAAYEHLLVSRSSDFDQWVEEGPDSDLLSDSAKRGAQLFVGKASCIDCHSTPLFSDDNFYNIGVPQEGASVPREADCPAGNRRCDCVMGLSCSPWGFGNGLRLLQANTTFRIDSAMYSDNPTNTSRKDDYERTVTEDLQGTWRTPSLRDAAITAPYMHNGFYRSLTEVVRHYNQGGTSLGAAPDQKSVRLAPLLLNDQEVDDLVAFLGTLTGAPLEAKLVTAPVIPGL